MKQIFTLVICVLLSYADAMAQNVLKGKILDATTGDPLIGANVVVKGTSEGNVTDFDGFFELSTSQSFPLTIVASYIGYNESEVVVNDANQKIDIRLGESSITVDVVEVKASRVSEKTKKSPLTVEALDALAIKETPAQDFYSGLGSLKGVDLTTASLGFTVINTRGFNSTSPVRSLQIIDGVDNQSPGLNFSLGNFLGSSELDIQKAELVVGASSAFYGPNAFNGVLSMETKNPFFNKGLSASLKVAERDMFQGALRFGQDVENSNGDAWMAYKLNFSYMRAYDWVADNYDPITDSEGNDVFADPKDNPGRYDAVNIYGDESSITYSSLYDVRAGLNTFHRTGYKEVDLVDYNTENIKAGGALHFRLNPSEGFESTELILASNFGYGTTVYQGDNRFSLRGIKFYQQRIELRKKDRFFIRAYATNEDANKSYDPYYTALRIQEKANSNSNWSNNYTLWWTNRRLGNVFNRMQALGYDTNDSEEEQIRWQQQYADSIRVWHNQASAFADSGEGTQALGPLAQPGTPEFQMLFDSIVALKNNDEEGGTRFFDKSALYHVHGEYKIPTSFFKEFRVGANARLYKPNTAGTIFSDAKERISNFEYGVYAGGTKELGQVTMSGAIRMDKNENFDYLFSPAASAVWNPTENNFLRLSFSSAIRNPTLSDQYLNLNVGPAKLLGNISGYKDLITVNSFRENSKDPNKPYEYIDIDPIQPEKVKTFEVGYRTALGGSLFLDGSYYYNIYNDFIGYQIVLDVPFVEVELFPGGPKQSLPDLNNIEVFRISANSKETVTTQGFAFGYNYYFGNYFAFNGNYSFNKLNTTVDDDIVPAFNTPEHKFNLGLGARNIPVSGNNVQMGFNVNYKWVEGFLFEGSPQFTGNIPTYDMVDAQINLSVKSINTTFKIGASNILDNKQFQTYGGPRIGRMAYISATYDFKEKI